MTRRLSGGQIVSRYMMGVINHYACEEGKEPEQYITERFNELKQEEREKKRLSSSDKKK